MTYDIIDSLDQISESVSDASVSVMNALVCEYDKLLSLMDSDVFMEGDIWDAATGKGKVESGLMKAIKFIPRLFGAIVNAITSVFKKESSADIDSRFATAEKTLATATNSQLVALADGVKTNSNGEVVFDPNKKEFFIKRGMKHVRNLAFIVMGLPKAFEAIQRKLTKQTTSYDSLVDELRNVLKGNKSMDSETFYVSIQALRDLYKDGYNASMGVRGLCSELSMMLEKKMHKDFDNGKNIDQAAKAKELLDEIGNASKIVMRFTGIMKTIHFVVEKCGGRIARDLRSKIVDPEKVEKSELVQQKREIKQRIKAAKHEYKKAAADKQRKDKLRKDILALEDKLKNLEGTYSDATDAAVERKMHDEEGDAAWNTIDPSTGKKQHEMVSSPLEDNPVANIYRDVMYGGT